MSSYFEWRFVVEEEVDANTWRSTSSHDTVEEAIRVAEATTRKSRVRQFKVTTIKVDDEWGDVLDGPPVGPTLVPLVPFFCPAHPTEKVQALQTSVPRCKTCRQEMFRGEKL